MQRARMRKNLAKVIKSYKVEQKEAIKWNKK